MTVDILLPGFPSPAPQFRMVRLQVFNWGTFSGLHDIPIAPEGFLFLGRSGAGKSTLLDAFSALLVPGKWLDFNAAARDAARAGRDRNLVSYVRGAWSVQRDDDSGDFATQYLRQGPTWSALALTYRNDAGQTVVLAQIFWLLGNAMALTEVKRLYLVLERPFDIRELDGFAFDVRKLKASLPDAFIRDEFSPYGERFRRLFGIESEMALRLLHKTQSAKNLGDLNLFLREFMLDPPETFEAAERLVTEFTELKEAHQAVVTARDQVQVLSRARQDHDGLLTVRQRIGAVETLLAGIDGYRREQEIALLTAHLQRLQTGLAALAGERQQADEALALHRSVVQDLERQHHEQGGGQIAAWERERDVLHANEGVIVRRRAEVQRACTATGWAFPTDPQSAAALAALAREVVEGWQAERDALQEDRDALRDRLRDQEQTFQATREAIEAMRRRPSNIDPKLLTLRQDLADDLGISEDDLPFAGELLEVKSEHAAWRGAIERVLGGLARAILVPERLYAAFSDRVNAVHLKRRLVFYRVGGVKGGRAASDPDSLPARLAIKPGPFADWLEAELWQRFNYRCVDSPEELRRHDRALTREGLVRHGASRHEKDDSHPVNDPRIWVLGFDNRDKLALFESQAQTQADAVAQLQQALQDLEARRQARETQASHGQSLANLQWTDIDLAALHARLQHLDRLLTEAREGNAVLKELERRLDGAKKALAIAEQALIQAGVKLEKAQQEIAALQDRLDQTKRQAETDDLSPEQRQGLQAQFAVLEGELLLEDLAEEARKVERRLQDESKSLGRQEEALAKTIEGAFDEFKKRWPTDAGDMDATLASAAAFFARLERLEQDGLPAFESRFFDLLRSQSQENLAALAQHLRLGRNAIHERMADVNAGLTQVPFNPGTCLQIQVQDRHLDEVRAFRQEINQALSHVTSDDRAEAEKRFLVLSRLVERLASQSPEGKRWKQAVLDVRQHVEFVGRELDQDGREVEVHRSGAGKSGGQRQKLATTCLAAALRYQLGGNDQGQPTYAPVILDEAFDKADSEFTTLAMQIFTNFGFQMIIATPLKSVMTLEPFIGGACLVDIQDRRHSGVLLIEYDRERQRLALADDAHDTPAALP